MSADILPPELWLLVFDHLMESTISPHEGCSFFDFPAVLLHLQGSEDYQPNTGLPRGILGMRLVCRAFNEILDVHLKKFPPYFKMKGTDATIPASAKAVCIESSLDAHSHLNRLLSEPPKAQMIVVLDIARFALQDGEEEQESYFELLCNHASSLPAVRSLTIGLIHRGHDYRCSQLGPTYGPPLVLNRDTPSFWGRLNEAFPRLACLMLRGWVETMDIDNVSFEHLEILDMDLLVPGPAVHFPALKYAAIRSISPEEIAMFSAWHRLESLIIREFDPTAAFDWRMLPSLRLLGVPHMNIYQFSPLPPNHPLEHLYIYLHRRRISKHGIPEMRRKDEMIWLKSTLECLPTIKKFIFAFPGRKSCARHPWYHQNLMKRSSQV